MNAGWFARRFPLYKKTSLGTLKLCVDGKEIYSWTVEVVGDTRRWVRKDVFSRQSSKP
jgi:hypothetical protein